MPRKRNIMREFRIDEISGVDVPAQEGATVTIMKRADPESAIDAAIAKCMSSAAIIMTSEFSGHQHGVGIDAEMYDHKGFYVGYGYDAQGREHFHPITTTAPLTIGVSMGHSHEIDQDSLIRLSLSKKGDAAMADDTTTTDDATTQDKDAKIQRLESIVGLTTEERAHFDALPEGMRDTFLGKSADDRRAEIVAKNDADPVVYTTIDGVEIRKSAGEAVLSLAKSNDQLRRDNDEMRKSAEQTALEKRAETELSHLPGDVATRAALLKAVDGMPEAHREGALAALKSKNELGKAAFQTMGHTGGSFEAGSAEEELDKMAKNIASTDGIDYHTAYAKALTSTEGQALYKRSVDAMRG